MAERPASTFRPDIEGLRGVAILLVVLFHAGVGALAGGFVGVDVFFVLSGFFITGILARQLARDGAVGLNEFWGSRSLRLLPALLVVLLATLAAVMFLYAPIDRAPIAGTGRSVALYAGNIEFARGGVNYFGSADNPYLHTWSLAVEEQFYLVWPLLFVMVAAMQSQSPSQSEAETGSGTTRRRLLAGIAAAGVLSLVASLWMTPQSQPSAFFGMPTRIWEFALGGVMALLLPNVTNDHTGAGTALQVGGLVALVFAVALYSAATPYPGAAALLPALATVALLMGGQFAPDSAVSSALSNPTLRWLGRLSYAWYLWHWPLVGLGAVLNWEIGVWGNLAWSGIALVLAWITYHFVEQPARAPDGLLSRIPAAAVAPAALGASVAVALVSHASMNLARSQASSPTQRPYAMARNDRLDHGCWSEGRVAPVGSCEFGDKNSSTTVVLFGDSHAEHWLGALDRAGKSLGWKVVLHVMGGCPVPSMPELAQHSYFEQCTLWREAALRQIVATRPRAVILSSFDDYIARPGKQSNWGVPLEVWRRGLRSTYERLTGAGITTIVLRDVPQAGFDVPSCLSRKAAGIAFARTCEYDRARALSPAGRAAQDAAARGLPVRFIDMNDRICPAPTCATVRNGAIVFTDDDHLTRSFSVTLAPVLGQRIAAILDN